MIARMSKVAMVGPKPLAMEVLATVQELGVLHIDQQIKLVPAEPGAPFKSSPLDEQALADRLYFEELLGKVNDLLECLPESPSRIPQLTARVVAQSLAEVADRHFHQWKEWCQGAEKLRAEIGELAAQQELVNRLHSLVERKADPAKVRIAVRLASEEQFAALADMLGTVLPETAGIARHKLKGDVEVAVITAAATDAPLLHERLPVNGVAGFERPLTIDAEQLRQAWEAAAKMLADLKNRLAFLEQQMETFTGRWRGIYLLAHDWLTEQLSLIAASADLYETEMCFWLFGWLPSPELPRLRAEVESRFGGRVVVEEEEIREQDLVRIPIVLKNPGYFQPFELFSRLLPVPSYASFDLTPFIALFFPLFFGMMLGDMGYGFILLVGVVITLAVARERPLLTDAAKIFGVCAVYTIIFGFLFGELFGAVGQRFLNLPHWLDRQESMLPMLYFALTAGVIHVALGLVLGMLMAFKSGEKREALFKLGSILLIGLMVLIGFSFQVESFTMLTRPLILVVGVLVPVLFITGGFMAPLEVLKTIGNIISYARIMAIGLTSVLLAYVANYFAGAIGSIWVGVLVAILLHAFNIVLGVFAPTIHSLRLHYVEFFSKFMAPGGGRKFSPLGKG